MGDERAQGGAAGQAGDIRSAGLRRPSGADVVADVTDIVWERFLERLGASASQLVSSPIARAELRAQVTDILTDVLDMAAAGPPSPLGDPQPGAAPDVGVARARAGVHPSESLWAAGLLFDIVLPVLIERRSLFPGLGAMDIALVLHRCITRRIVPASIAYVDVLLSRIHESHRGERARIARDLHDRLLHGVAVALQCLELYTFDSVSRPEHAATRLEQARKVLLQNAEDMRALAAGLRDEVGQRRLDAALASYLEGSCPDRLRVGIVSEGDLASIPPHVAEEVFVLAREAMHNSILHAYGATRLDVRIRVQRRRLTVEVCDDGPGFDPAAVPKDSFGLTSMRERAELLGGRLNVETGPQRGAMVRVWVPLPLES